MKTRYSFPLFAVLISLVCMFLLPVHAFAQAAADSASVVAPSQSLADNLVTWLTPVIVPLVIAGMKKVMPSIPGVLLPLIAPVLGMLLDFINSMATAHSTNLLAAAALGLAGVGVREAVDQAKQKVILPT